MTEIARLYRYLLSHHHHTFNGPLSGITRVSRYQKGKTNLDFNGARDSEWLWHQLGHMQVCTSLQTDNHASTPPLSFFTGRMLFLPPNQQRQSTVTYCEMLYYFAAVLVVMMNASSAELALTGSRRIRFCILIFKQNCYCLFSGT